MIKNILNFINNNGIASSLIASIIFALVIFFISTDKSVLTYEIVENKKLFESTDNEALIILNKDSQEVNQDIYYLEIDLWNQGNKQIEKEDLKESLSLIFTDSVLVLGKFKIIETHPEVTNTKIDIDSLSKSITILFKYLEKGNGIKLIGYYSTSNEFSSGLTHSGYISKGGVIKCYNESFTQEYSTLIIIVFLLVSGVFIWYSSKYAGKLVSKLVDNYIPYEKYGNWNITAYIIVSIPILYFVLVKFIAKIPGWIKDFLINYFNPDSPFNQ